MSNDNGSFTQLPGGTLSYQSGLEALHQEAPVAPSEHHLGNQGTYRSVGGGKVEFEQPQTFLSSQLRHGSGILGTAWGAGGNPTADPARMHSVEVPGVGRVSMQEAVILGVLRQGGDGTYSEVGSPAVAEGEQQEQQEDEQEQNAEEAVENFPPAVEAAVNQAIADVPQHVYDGVAASVAGSLANIDALDYGRIGDAAGLQPERAQAIVSSLVEAFTVQASMTAEKLAGLPRSSWNDFADWARENRKEQAAECMRRHVHERKPGVWVSLVKEFMSKTTPSAASVSKQHDVVTVGGVEGVTIKGQFIDLKSAARMGLI